MLSYAQACETFGDFIVLVGFGSRLPDVLKFIYRMATEREVYAPDLPLCDDVLFDTEFYSAHKAQFDTARALFSDETSRTLFDDMIAYKLSGDLRYFERTISREQAWQTLMNPDSYRIAIDAGAYNGDTASEMLHWCHNIEKIYALEPDSKNFARLMRFVEASGNGKIQPVNAAVLDYCGAISLNSSGNRNSRISPQNRAVENSVNCICLDKLTTDRVDLIKYDVEGSEEAALLGSAGIIAAHAPDLIVSAYHKSTDLYRLPRLIRELNPKYKLYLYRHPYVPAWDLNIFATN